MRITCFVLWGDLVLILKGVDVHEICGWVAVEEMSRYGGDSERGLVDESPNVPLREGSK